MLGYDTMKILGIESSCDETACAVVQDGKTVLSNIVASQIDEHRLYGGVVPEIASRRHAKGLALAAKKPLVPVHHIAGHIAANYISHPDLKPPYLCLVVSGGHSHIVEVLDYCKYRVVGRTRDDAAGERFDKVARTLGYEKRQRKGV